MRKLLTLFALAFNLCLYAQPGTLDTTFNPGTVANQDVSATAIQSDGKIIIAGFFSAYNGTTRSKIVRLSPDGSLDATFNSDTGIGNTGGQLLYIQSIALQTDGKIIVGGRFTTYNGTTRNNIVRINTDASLDTTFNPGTGANQDVWAIAIQGDGKIIIGGFFSAYNGTTRNDIARLNPDGSLDATFNSGTGADYDVRCIAIQSDGKIIIGGNFGYYNGIARSHITRLNTNGSLDAAFNIGTGPNGSVLSTAIQSDGKIIIGGVFDTYNSVQRSGIARINTDGSLDTTFNPGTGAEYDVYTTVLQSDRKVIIGGNFYSYNGTLRKHIARLNTDASLDTAFNPGSGANDWVNTTALQSDGKIIIGGRFTTYNDTARSYIARLNGDGTLDINTISSTANSITLYPNPASTQLYIQTTGTAIEQVNIYNTTGSLVLAVSPSSVNCQLSTITLPPGVYIADIKTKEGSVRKRWVKM